MKAIQLTEQQEIKLYEMCKELFPEEIKFTKWNNNKKEFLKESCIEYPEYEHIFWDLPYIEFKNTKYITDYSTEIFIIHWFEFCYTELPKRIYDKLKDTFDYESEEQTLIKDFNFKNYNELLNFNTSEYSYIKNKHPVDFLYDFVQECKKNKYFK